jgi:CRP-like cAMP-binding protein
MHYEKFPEQTAVFLEGDKSNDKFYVILRGSVSVLLAKRKNIFKQENAAEEEKKEEPPKQAQSGAHTTKHLARQISSLSSFGLLSQPTEPNLVTAMSLGDKINEMVEGESFGDKALLSKDAKRTASIVANVPLECLILMREDFLAMMGRFNIDNIRKRDFLVHTIPGLDEIYTVDILDEYMYNIREEKYYRHEFILKENEKNDKLYFLFEGACSLSHMVTFTNGKRERLKVVTLSSFSPTPIQQPSFCSIRHDIW